MLSLLDTKVQEAIDKIREGGLVIIADDEDRENEGDLVCAADKVTPEIINFMATHGRGLVCLTLDPDIADHLDLPLMSDGRSSDPNDRTGSFNGNQCGGQGTDDPGRGGSRVSSVGPHSTRAHLSIEGEARWRAPARRTDGSVRRYRAAG